MHADHHGGSQSPCWWRRMHPSKFILATARIRQHMPNVWFKIYNHPCVLQAPTSNLRRHFLWNCKGRIPGFLASCSRFIPCLLDCFLASFLLCLPFFCLLAFFTWFLACCFLSCTLACFPAGAPHNARRKEERRKGTYEHANPRASECTTYLALLSSSRGLKERYRWKYWQTNKQNQKPLRKSRAVKNQLLSIIHSQVSKCQIVILPYSPFPATPPGPISQAGSQPRGCIQRTCSSVKAMAIQCPPRKGETITNMQYHQYQYVKNHVSNWHTCSFLGHSSTVSHNIIHSSLIGSRPATAQFYAISINMRLSLAWRGAPRQSPKTMPKRTALRLVSAHPWGTPKNRWGWIQNAAFDS